MEVFQLHDGIGSINTFAIIEGLDPHEADRAVKYSLTAGPRLVLLKLGHGRKHSI
jgi:hypothetical protein